jgi:tetratricopeptide (TPR) repeat protein
MENFQKAVKLDPKYAEARNNLAGGYYMQNKFAEAAEQYEKAVEISPYYLDARKNLALACLKLGKLNEALAHYRFIEQNTKDNYDLRTRISELEALLDRQRNLHGAK